MPTSTGEYGLSWRNQELGAATAGGRKRDRTLWSEVGHSQSQLFESELNSGGQQRPTRASMQ